MKKLVLFLLAIVGIAAACNKPSVQTPLSYTIESGQNAPLGDIYVPDNGTYTMPVLAKYLTGASEEKVTLSIKGLPTGVKVNKDTFSQVPTYRADFVFTSTNAPHGVYPITVTSSARGSEAKTYKFNMTVRSADCAANLLGNFNCTNECTGRNYPYIATGVATGVTDELSVKNFGGYGNGTTTRIVLNCNLNTLTIPSQNIGNGVVLQGSGTFTGNSMTISYTASGTVSETCNAKFVR
ncbi:MAG: hypothetical protein IAE95_10500 [Chitinophagaceae bacterium]|nr:hypothetical protein [Chitinophagaceae bacterium]